MKKALILSIILAFVAPLHGAMLNLGAIEVDKTIYVPFASYGADGESITMSTFALGDIKIYKDGSTTERASTSGFTLLDTDGTDFDGITGIHGFSIDLSDDTTSGFYSEGSEYWIVIDDVTINTQTVSFVAAVFNIQNRNSVLDELLTDSDHNIEFSVGWYFRTILEQVALIITQTMERFIKDR